MKNIIEIKNLKKSFGEIRAVDDLTFSVREGELFAFLGENGAGKSTTISIFCGQLQKDGGQVWIDGENLDENLNVIKSKLGVVFQNSVLDKQLTVYENLEHRASLYGIFGEEFKKRMDELNGLLELDELLNRPLGKLSGGQRRRIDIARALIHEPKILVLDEPTTGLDPQTRKSVWEVIEKLRKEKGLTVFLTTHYMEEAAEADYIVILDRGKICAEGTPLALKNAYVKDFIILYNVSEEQAKKLERPYLPLRDGYKIEVESVCVATKLILSYPEIFVDYEIMKGKMDDVFLSVTGKTLEGGKV
ncbi:MAG: ABC transporter ATP-binding protein [Clostridia bacterium]|nr:ABC transporter ATP-binding protein [Clostridia bacterium]